MCCFLYLYRLSQAVMTNNCWFNIHHEYFVYCKKRIFNENSPHFEKRGFHEH